MSAASRYCEEAMLSEDAVSYYQQMLPDTVSDLMVALTTSDAPEVLYQGSILKDLTAECQAAVLWETAHKIEQAATSGELDIARTLVPELQQHLRQALATLAS
jgi:magnesium-transporting ATPase (P-type)